MLAAAPGAAPARTELPEPDRWDLSHIYPDWAAWDADYTQLEARVKQYETRRGTLGRGADALLGALQESDAMGQLAYKIWYYASLAHDEDQRDNTIGARRQRVQILFAAWKQATSWFTPELLEIGVERIREWTEQHTALAVYRFFIEDLYRQQEHVLDARGERLLSLASHFSSAPDEAFEALSTADVRFPTIRLSTGEEVTPTYPRYRAILATNRVQADRAAAFTAHHETYHATRNTYAALYNGVLQRDWFMARARGYPSMIEAALHTNNIPVSVVENLVATTRSNAQPLQRYERLRRRALGLDKYHVYDGSIPLIDFNERYPYRRVLDWIVESVAPLGSTYQNRLRAGFDSRWIDVYENQGKRSGAYSAAVYGVHPYVLMNYNDTLDAVFTLAHEMGHSMHTVLTHERQPFIYSDYTIFVAEVPSTLSEALLLDYMLQRSTDPVERAVLLQHAIDSIVGTFYTQVMFADFELRAHVRVEEGQPITADVLSDIYFDVLQAYHADSLDYDDLVRVTWARIPHFFSAPYYVYQYATCYASSAHLLRDLRAADEHVCQDAIGRYLALLASGSSDHPMALLARAGVDLARPGPILAVVEQLDTLVDQLERELIALGSLA
ncbi:MAG: oligoendopeptidase F [Luteitalea sp.]|nr:oligoendopeptidase F [Luteitalea sp.]